MNNERNSATQWPNNLFSILHKMKSPTLSINKIRNLFQTNSIDNLIQLLDISVSVSLTVALVRMTTARSYRMCFSKHTNQPLHKILLFLSVLRWFCVFRAHFIQSNIYWMLALVHSMFILSFFSSFFYSRCLTPIENEFLDLKKKWNDNNRAVLVSKIIHLIDRLCSVSAQLFSIHNSFNLQLHLHFGYLSSERWTYARTKSLICVNSYSSLCSHSWITLLHQSKSIKRNSSDERKAFIALCICLFYAINFKSWEYI